MKAIILTLILLGSFANCFAQEGFPPLEGLLTIDPKSIDSRVRLEHVIREYRVMSIEAIVRSSEAEMAYLKLSEGERALVPLRLYEDYSRTVAELLQPSQKLKEFCDEFKAGDEIFHFDDVSAQGYILGRNGKVIKILLTSIR